MGFVPTSDPEHTVQLSKCDAWAFGSSLGLLLVPSLWAPSSPGISQGTGLTGLPLASACRLAPRAVLFSNCSFSSLAKKRPPSARASVVCYVFCFLCFVFTSLSKVSLYRRSYGNSDIRAHSPRSWLLWSGCHVPVELASNMRQSPQRTLPHRTSMLMSSPGAQRDPAPALAWGLYFLFPFSQEGALSCLAAAMSEFAEVTASQPVPLTHVTSVPCKCSSSPWCTLGVSYTCASL